MRVCECAVFPGFEKIIRKIGDFIGGSKEGKVNRFIDSYFFIF